MPSESNQLKFVCPMPQVWARISAELSKVFRSTDSITQEPPRALILGGWTASDYDKNMRWEETITWAKENDCIHLIPELDENEKYSVQEFMPELWGDDMFEDSIFYAAEYDVDISWLQECIDGGSDVNQVDSVEESPLVIAAREGFAEGVKLLVDSGADLKRDGASALGIALQEEMTAGRKVVVSFLIEQGVSVDDIDDIGWTALMHAASFCPPETLRDILSFQPNVNYRASGNHMTPLMNAACSGSIEKVQMLLEHGADPTMIDNEGQTAQDWAVANTRGEVVDLLENWSGQSGLGTISK